IAQAVFPSLFVGLVFALVIVANYSNSFDLPASVYFVPGWALLYGFALHSAGFFMPRGVRLFGWFFVASGLAMILGMSQMKYVSGNLAMGVIFGGFHLGHGI